MMKRICVLALIFSVLLGAGIAAARDTVAIVTHSMQQASRVSQRTAYFHLGDLIEIGPTEQIFTNPLHQLTENYITGRFG